MQQVFPDRQRLAALVWMVLVVAGLWALAVLLLGGIVIDLGPLHLVSRDATRALAVAAACAVVIAAPLRDQRPPFARWPESRVARVAVAVALFPLAFGVAHGTFVASGADAYGYVSQAQLWLDGTLRVDQPLAGDLPWPNAQEILAPLGYRPSVDGRAIVPTYAPGLPIAMALAQAVVGPSGPYLLGPVAAGLTVWLTFLVGRRWFDGWSALAASGWLALSPAFLFSTVWPMSDVPATCLTMAGVALAELRGWGWAVLRGVAVLLLMLVRPNLALVCAAVALLPPSGDQSDRRWSRGLAVAGIGVGALVVALNQSHLYGAPWRTGYGSTETLYSLEALWPNLQRYPVWLVDVHTPMVLLALVPLLWRPPSAESSKPLLAWAVIGAVWTSYLFYAPFEDWWYLRFVLPSLPLMWCLAAAVWRGAGIRVRLAPGTAAVLLWASWLAVAAWEAREVSRRGVRSLQREEARYAAVGAFIDARLPANAVILTSQHSGSARLYGGRLTARWDLLPPGSLEDALAVFEARGLRPYLALEAWEEAQLLGRLVPPPGDVASLGVVLGEWRDPGLVRVYDPRGRRSVAVPERITGR